MAKLKETVNSMISREFLEKNQIWIYVLTLISALIVGLQAPDFSAHLGLGISFVLATLMYGMFSQIPFFHLKKALQDRQFISALIVTNFIAVPIVVFILTRFLPDNPALLLGVLLVLLTPCIDYVIVFTQLGQGNEKLMLISTPLLFLLQMMLLPPYLWLFMGKEAAKIIQVAPFVESFFGLILLPLLFALLTQWWAREKQDRLRILSAAAWLPVPFMAATLFLVVASQIAKLYTFFDSINDVIPIYIAYMILIPFVAHLIARLFCLQPEAERTLIFSAGTRNSLVVLPLAFALPEPLHHLVAAVIVTQTIVELMGELIYIYLIPKMVHKN